MSGNLNRLQSRHRFGDQRHQKLHAPDCYDQTTQAAEAGEQHAFGKQLTHQPNTSRAKRRADREFLLTPLGPGQRQIRGVRTDDEQHEANGCQQTEQRPAEVV